jgi:DNA (cytosine-5)-methyltransferase 1
MYAYYNENDPYMAFALRRLIQMKLIPDGEVDSRSIKDVQPDDLDGFTQHHFFAGIAGWGLATTRAGWPAGKPLWTASCPCQPFSAAGRGAGVDDPRHLWPDVLRLARARRPSILVGEQVSGKAGYGWFDGVSADLEGEGYASRAVDVPALAVDAPHIRNRLYWLAVADADGSGRQGGHAGATDQARCCSRANRQRGRRQR